MQKTAILFLLVWIGSVLAAEAAAQAPLLPTKPVPNPRSSPKTVEGEQQPAVAPCPMVNVMAQPSQVVRDGQPVVFIANLEGGDPKVQPTIVWNTSAGLVTQGQQTRRIQVDSTGAGNTPDREIKADVWVGGYAPECSVQASSAVKIIPPATKFGEFGEVDDKTLKTNLEALAGFLSQTPDTLYFIAYAGRNSERGFTMTWAKRIKESLVAAGVESRRIVALDGGFREQPLFDFWTVPNGAEPPRPTPTVKRSEIVYPKMTPAKKP
jgi:hypothetical protein